MRALVLALTEVASIGTTGLFDALRKSDAAWQLTDPAAPPLFDVAFVGLDGDAVHCRDGVWIHPTAVADDVARPDLVLVPGLDDELLDSLRRNITWADRIADWAAAGAVVASSCTGAFLVAESGLLDGRVATTHWFAAAEFRRRYPAVDLRPDRMIVDGGSVVTSGGATTFLNLVVHLTRRIGGADRAAQASRLLLVDQRTTQLPYTILTGTPAHEDPDVHAVQERIRSGLAGDLSVVTLAADRGLSPRTLERRFRSALGMSPTAYVRLARVEAAKHLLETTGVMVGVIHQRVGYDDAAAFRRSFKRLTGVSPSAYRRRFAQPVGE